MNMNITFTRSELCRLLQVSNENFKKIRQRGNLEYRLKLVDYELVKEYKEGRNTLYDLKPCDKSEWFEMQNKYHIRKEKLKEHTKYSINRIKDNSGLKASRTQFIKDNEIDISGSTAKRWDDILIKEKAMKKDETVYFLLNTKSNSFIPITQEEYKQFWKDNYELKYQLANNRHRFEKGEITKDTYEQNIIIFSNAWENKTNVIAVKFDTYKEAENTKKIISMIKNK